MITVVKLKHRERIHHLQPPTAQYFVDEKYVAGKNARTLPYRDKAEQLGHSGTDQVARYSRIR